MRILHNPSGHSGNASLPDAGNSHLISSSDIPFGLPTGNSRTAGLESAGALLLPRLEQSVLARSARIIAASEVLSCYQTVREIEETVDTNNICAHVHAEVVTCP